MSLATGPWSRCAPPADRLRAGDTAWAPRCSAGRTAGSAGPRRRNAQLHWAMRGQDPLLLSDYSKLQEILLREEGVLLGEGVAGVGHFFDDGVARDEVIF